MYLGNDGERPDEPRLQPGLGPHETPTPPYPFGGMPTPTYQPQPDGPAQRLADARRGGRRGGRHSDNPDGPPAPLPASVLGVRWRGPGGRSPVVQRFFGSGLAPATRVERQERRAQRATALLAALALLVISASAILIFDPSFELASFGFALNQRLHKQKSDAPLYVDGTAPPTPTSASSGSPTATPQVSSAGATATPQPTATLQPTATPRPTFTPTVTPTVIPSGAVVKFTATTVPISKSSFTGCGSGCDFQTANAVNVAGPTKAGGSVRASGYQSTQVGGTWEVKLESKIHCWEDLNGNLACNQSAPNFGGGALDFSGNGGWTCNGLWVPGMGVGATRQSQWCNYATTNTSYVPSNTVTGYTSYTVQVSSTEYYGYRFYFYNDAWKSTGGYSYILSQDCNSAIANADPLAKSAANAAASSWVISHGGVQLYETLQQITNSSLRYCSPGVNARASSTTGYATWDFTATAFDPNAAVSAASSYVQSHVPSGYLLTAGPNTCTAAQAGSSGNYSYSGGYNGTVTVTCSATGTATYDWTSDTQGTNAQNSLKAAIEGKSLSQAQSICNSFTGVAGSCTITLTGGNVQVVPSDPNQIQILAS